MQHLNRVIQLRKVEMAEAKVMINTLTINQSAYIYTFTQIGPGSMHPENGNDNTTVKD